MSDFHSDVENDVGAEQCRIGPLATPHSNASLGYQKPAVSSLWSEPRQSQQPTHNRNPQTHIIVNVGATPANGSTKASRVLFENQDINIREEISGTKREKENEAEAEVEPEIPLMCSVPEHHLLEDKLGLLLESEESALQQGTERSRKTSRIVKDR